MWFALLAVTVSADCSFAILANDGNCYSWNLTALPYQDYFLKDSYPDSYVVTSACHTIPDTSTLCKAGQGSNAPSPGYQFYSDGSCLALGNLTQVSRAALNASNPGQGIAVTYNGGDSFSCGGTSRSITYNFVCNKSVAVDNGPEPLVGTPSGCVYVVTWNTPLACPVLSPGLCPLPTPTQAQLKWMSDEIGAIGHFNMETYQDCGIGSTHHIFATKSEGIANSNTGPDACCIVPPPSTFDPTNVTTDQWVQALTSFGAKHAVLVVSHGCGFNTFPSRTAFPDFGFVYNYTVQYSPWKNGTGDIAAEFVSSCRKYGIRPGFYLGIMNNAFLNVQSGIVGTGDLSPGQVRVTQDQYTQIVLAQLRQVWTDYGELAEVWFDGGYPPGAADQIAALLQELQPNAVAFQGPGVNTIRWVGTETGHGPDPDWSTAESSLDAGAGEPDGAVWTPAESDTCFQTPPTFVQDPVPYPGCWFYNPYYVPKSLTELVSIYHDSVGHNSYLLLDWTPTTVGDMRPDHLQRYQEFGSYLQSCYGTSLGGTSGTGTTLYLNFQQAAKLDRFVLQEDQQFGQRVRSYTLAVSTGGGYTNVYTGQSIGNKHIALLSAPITGVTSAQLTIQSTVDVPVINTFSAYYCTPPS